MKHQRFVAAVLIVCLLLSAIAVGLSVYLGSRPIEAKGSADNFTTVTVQVAPNTFYDINVCGEANLVRANYQTSYEYDILSVSVVDAEPTSSAAYVKVGDKWVAVSSKDNWTVPSRSSMTKNHPYEGNVDLSEYKRTQTVTEYEKCTPNTVGQYYTDDGFCTYILKYADFESTKQEYAAKMVYLFKETISTYYEDDGVFYITAGDYMVGVRYANYNTTIAVTAKGQEAINNAMSILFDMQES